MNNSYQSKYPFCLFVFVKDKIKELEEANAILNDKAKSLHLLLESERERNVKNQGVVSLAANCWWNWTSEGFCSEGNSPVLLTKSKGGVRGSWT